MQIDKDEIIKKNTKNTVRIYKAQSHHDANIQAIDKHKGFINVNCVSSKSSVEIVNGLMGAVRSLKYSPKIVILLFYVLMF